MFPHTITANVNSNRLCNYLISGQDSEVSDQHETTVYLLDAILNARVFATFSFFFL